MVEAGLNHFLLVVWWVGFGEEKGGVARGADRAKTITIVERYHRDIYHTSQQHLFAVLLPSLSSLVDGHASLCRGDSPPPLGMP